VIAYGRYFEVASKCGFDVFGPTRRVTNSAAHIKEYIEGTIDRLGFTPDLYYLHRIDPGAWRSPKQTISDWS
jgi:aryl-alcohol dehydrogenase-like predicted oxidoreductase